MTMSNPADRRHLTVIARSAAGQPRTFRVEPVLRATLSLKRAYRRLTAGRTRLNVSAVELSLRGARVRFAAN